MCDVVLLMGVCGSGKTSVGLELASKFNGKAVFMDADWFHPQENIVKMASGQPLTDEDRIPRLINIHNNILDELKKNHLVILACSALKKSYRTILKCGNSQTPVFKISKIFLNGSSDVIQNRLTQRQNHFMNPTLLKSQFDTLEIPNKATVIDIDTLSVLNIVELLFEEFNKEQ